MSPVGAIVATSERKNREISWKLRKISVTLHCQSEQTTFERQEKKTVSLTIKNSKIMVKKNEEESPRTLKEEELENVNGGGTKKKRKYEP